MYKKTSILKAIGWGILFFPAAETIGKTFDYSIWALILAMGIGLVSILCIFWDNEFASNNRKETQSNSGNETK
jgi:hypothetical protein